MSPTSALSGKRIVVTRARAQAAALADKLSARGAVPILLPAIEIAPPPDYARLDEALRHLAGYHWLIFTSVNGVEAFWQRLAAAGRGQADLRGRRVAAIGPATAEALAQRGVYVERVPDEYVAEAVVEALGEVDGQWILLPRAEIARPVLAEELRRRGARVDEIAVYRTLAGEPDPAALADLQRGVDAVTFASASTVRNFLKLLDGQPQAAVLKASLARAAIACIGPITAQAARVLGLTVAVQAEVYTMDGLVEALEAHFEKKTGDG